MLDMVGQLDHFTILTARWAQTKGTSPELGQGHSLHGQGA